jgi:predicted Zn-dependent protease
MKWSDNDDNWRDYAEAHPAQVERIKEAGRRSDPKKPHSAQPANQEPKR